MPSWQAQPLGHGLLLSHTSHAPTSASLMYVHAVQVHTSPPSAAAGLSGTANTASGEWCPRRLRRLRRVGCPSDDEAAVCDADAATARRFREDFCAAR